LDIKLGEIVQIKLKAGEQIRGCIIERFASGFRLSNAIVLDEQANANEKGDDNWISYPGLIEVNWNSIESLQIIRLGP
jgi:hypothetical protein